MPFPMFLAYSISLRVLALIWTCDEGKEDYRGSDGLNLGDTINISVIALVTVGVFG